MSTDLYRATVFSLIAATHASKIKASFSTASLDTMELDTIAVVEIDKAGQLHVVPSSHTFPYIYREAMEVGWDPERRSLHSPKPREWSYSRWYEQILAAAREQGWDLPATASTRRVNVEPGVKAMLLQVHGQGA